MSLKLSYVDRLHLELALNGAKLLTHNIETVLYGTGVGDEAALDQTIDDLKWIQKHVKHVRDQHHYENIEF